MIISKRRLQILFIFCFFCLLRSYAQFPIIDSGRRVIAEARTDEKKLEAAINFLKYRNSLSADTIARYSDMVYQLATALKNEKALRSIEYNRLTGLLVKGLTDSVLNALENNPSLKFPKKNDPDLYYKLAILKANAINRSNDRAKALDLQLALLNESIQDKDTNTQLFLLNYLGATYLNLGRAEEARNYWKNGVDLIGKSTNSKFKEIEAYICSNLQLYYYNLFSLKQGKPLADTFLIFSNRTIDICRQYGIYGVLASALSYKGSYYGLIGQDDLADKEFSEMIAIREKIGDPLYIMNDYTNLASYFFRKKQYDRAIELSTAALSLATRSGIKADKFALLTILGASYKAKGDLVSYSSALEKFIAENDSFHIKNAAEKIAEVEAKYELQKKQALITEQSLVIAKRNNTLLISGFLVLILIGTSIGAFINYKRKQRVKNKLAIEEAENRERTRIAAELHDNMGVQANAILHNSSLLADESGKSKEIITNLQDTAKEMLGNLRETVWALKSTTVTAGETWLRVISFTKQTGKSFPNIKFNLTGSAPQEWSLTSIRALHLIMVIKESVNNAIKHSGSHEINIQSAIDDNDWNISVADKGKGFDVNSPAIEGDGNGLANMRLRATAGKFMLEQKAAPGLGATISIKIPKD